MKSPKFIMPVQSFAFGGIANPAQSAYLSSADKAYLGEQQQKLDAFEQQRLAYNDALTAWQEKQYNPYVTQAEAYNAAAKKYNDEVYSPYQSAYDVYTKAVADWNAGSRTADYAGPSMPTLASTFDMVAPKEPGAFDMVAPEVPFKEEEIAAYQQAAGRRAQDSPAKRAVAIDVVSDPERFNFGSMSISNRFMAEGGEVKDKRSARAMLDEVDGADDDAAVLRIHRSADERHGLAQQRLRGSRIAGLDDHAGPFVAHRHRLVGTPGHGLHELLGHARRQHRSRRGAFELGSAHVGGAEEQAQIGRVDRRGLDAHQHLVSGRLGHRHFLQRDFELAVGANQRTQLQGLAWKLGAHAGSLQAVVNRTV